MFERPTFDTPIFGDLRWNVNENHLSFAGSHVGWKRASPPAFPSSMLRTGLSRTKSLVRASCPWQQLRPQIPSTTRLKAIRLLSFSSEALRKKLAEPAPGEEMVIGLLLARSVELAVAGTLELRDLGTSGSRLADGCARCQDFIIARHPQISPVGDLGNPGHRSRLRAHRPGVPS